jgi:hypothetical protein
VCGVFRPFTVNAEAKTDQATTPNHALVS